VRRAPSRQKRGVSSAVRTAARYAHSAWLCRLRNRSIAARTSSSCICARAAWRKQHRYCTQKQTRCALHSHFRTHAPARRHALAPSYLFGIARMPPLSRHRLPAAAWRAHRAVADGYAPPFAARIARTAAPSAKRAHCAASFHTLIEALTHVYIRVSRIRAYGRSCAASGISCDIARSRISAGWRLGILLLGGSMACWYRAR